VVTAVPPEVLHVGSACRDVAPDDPRGWRLGGGVTYSALTTARLGLRTAAVVGVEAEARGAAELDLLRGAGVDLMLVPLPEGPVFLNEETPAGRRQTCIRPGVPLPVPPLPESWQRASAWSIVPVAGEVKDDWAAAIPAEAMVSVAWQGFLRRLVAGELVSRKPPQASPLLWRADIVGASHHDLDPATPLESLFPLLRPGAHLLITQGWEGGLLIALGEDGPAETLRYRAAETDGEVDPTGAGDTFLAALLSTAVHHGIGGHQRRRLDLRVAAAAGSLVVEAPGLAGVADREAVRMRMVRERVRRFVEPSAADRVGSYRDGGWREALAASAARRRGRTAHDEVHGQHLRSR
jgi:sugar/nucleoside kinase (ribokinase family)